MFKKIRKPLLTLIILHVVLGFLHLLFFDLGHPLNKYIESLPIYFQILVVSAYALIVYLIGGYLVIIALNKDSEKMKGIGQALLYVLMFLLLVFTGIYISFVFNGRQSLWLIYSFVNPLFGTAMYNAMPDTWMGGLWLISVAIPGLGVLLGMILGSQKGSLRE